ncbi:MAG: hypothetical protein AB7U79_00105 [Candidatus Izemoplasmatales bacterium]
MDKKELLSAKLRNKYHFSDDQLNFVLSFSPKTLKSEEFHGFSPFYHFKNVLKILESNQDDRTAVLVDKEYGRLYVYDRAVTETKPGDSYFKYIEQVWREDVLRFLSLSYTFPQCPIKGMLKDFGTLISFFA